MAPMLYLIEEHSVLQSFLLNGAYRQDTSFQWKDKCSKPFLTFSLAHHFIFQIKAHSDGSESLTSDDVPHGGHAYSCAADSPSFCSIPSSLPAEQSIPSAVIKLTPHHASSNRTHFLSKWTDRLVPTFEVPNGFFFCFQFGFKTVWPLGPLLQGPFRLPLLFCFQSLCLQSLQSRTGCFHPTLTTHDHHSALWKSLFKK